jgi:tRNA-2-methylthio-N6-dimethylallyladenosine synthase
MFAPLLRAIGAVDGLRRVRFTSPHPKDMTADVFAAMAETPSVVGHLHFPLQSGSDRILAAMHRGYTGARYLEKLAAARHAIDDLAVSTDIIVGFPGETEDDFAATLELAAEARFDSAYTFVFSPREGTEAASMADRFCDPEEVKDRYARLRTVIERSALERYRARIGRVEEVVVEGRSKKDAALLTGRTAHNKLVHFPAETLRPGTYAATRIVDASHQYLLGQLVEVVARPTHRTQIPVVSAG